MALPDISPSLEPEPVGIGGSATAFDDAPAATARAVPGPVSWSRRDATAAVAAVGPAQWPAFLAAGPVDLPGLAGVWIDASAQFWLGTLELAVAFGRMLFGDMARPSVAASEAARDRLGPPLPWRPSRPRSALVRLNRPPA